MRTFPSGFTFVVNHSGLFFRSILMEVYSAFASFSAILTRWVNGETYNRCHELTMR